MSDIKFSADLFEQIGGTSWVTRPGWFADAVKNSTVEEVVESKSAEAVRENQFSETGKQESSVTKAFSDEVVEVYQAEDRRLSMDKVADDTTVLSKELSDQGVVVHVENAVVVIGPGLESVWQNESNVAWQLWQNIMKAFNWDESQVIFFDTELLVSEDMVFSTMEEVIDLGVEWVLAMDDSHEIFEQLAEGVHVVTVPDFESMLADPYAKQSFYHSLIELNLSH